MTQLRSPFLRLVFLPISVAGILVLAHREWKKRGIPQGGERRALLDKADTSFHLFGDSLLHRRIGPDGPQDPLALARRHNGWPLRKSGRDSGWTWGCYQTPDSGIVVFFAFDSGCATQQGSFWTDAMSIHWRTWDLLRKDGGPERDVHSSKTYWTYPGDHRMCLPTRANHPPDSIQALCQGPADF